MLPASPVKVFCFLKKIKGKKKQTLAVKSSEAGRSFPAFIPQIK